MEFTSQSAGRFHNMEGGSMYTVTGDVQAVWDYLDKRSSPIVFEVTNIDEVQIYPKWIMCDITIRLNTSVITISRLEIPK